MGFACIGRGVWILATYLFAVILEQVVSHDVWFCSSYHLSASAFSTIVSWESYQREEILLLWIHILLFRWNKKTRTMGSNFIWDTENPYFLPAFSLVLLVKIGWLDQVADTDLVFKPIFPISAETWEAREICTKWNEKKSSSASRSSFNFICDGEEEQKKGEKHKRIVNYLFFVWYCCTSQRLDLYECAVHKKLSERYWNNICFFTSVSKKSRPNM